MRTPRWTSRRYNGFMTVSPVPSAKKYAPAPLPSTCRRKKLTNAIADIDGMAVVSPYS